MKFVYKYVCFCVVILGVVFLVPEITHADFRDGLYGNLGATADGVGYPNARDPRFIAALIIRTLLTLLGIIFLSLTVYGGFLFMTAGGVEDQVEKGKKTITRGVLGIVIILSAYAITRFVTSIIFMNNEPQQEGINFEQEPETFDQIFRGNDELLRTGPYNQDQGWGR